MNARDFQERKKFERLFYSWTSIIITCIFLVLIVFGIAKLWRKERGEIAQIALLDQKIAETTLARQKYVQRLQSLGTESGIEEKI
jgi:hypothetical protein